LLAVIGFPHAENVTIRATRCVPDDNHSIIKEAEANDSALAIVSTQVLRLEVGTLKDNTGIVEIKATCGKSSFALRWIVCDLHVVSVTTLTAQGKRQWCVSL
jgi:hypothetical protein